MDKCKFTVNYTKCKYLLFAFLDLFAILLLLLLYPRKLVCMDHIKRLPYHLIQFEPQDWRAWGRVVLPSLKVCLGLATPLDQRLLEVVGDCSL